ncbi:hypothetical protein H0H87_001019 [Tephrocybe sp. NHM501043]|nr:hypothetical protein H0H87_001019 [Tephrocybe sp. NHM501043]
MVTELNGFTAWVTVDDQELPQYGLEVNLDAKRAVCWIPSQAGKAFTVCWRDLLGIVPSVGYLAIDGMPCGAKHIYSSAQKPRGRVDTTRKSSISTSANTERPLTFAPLEITDDELYLDKPTSPSLGDIRLVIFEASIKNTMSFVQPGMPPDKQVIHERTKKTVVHCVRRGPLLNMLKANGILLADRTEKRKARDAVSREIIDLTEDWDESVRKRMKVEVKPRIKAEIKMKVKKEVTTEFIKTEPEIKQEHELERPRNDVVEMNVR